MLESRSPEGAKVELRSAGFRKPRSVLCIRIYKGEVSWSPRDSFVHFLSRNKKWTREELRKQHAGKSYKFLKSHAIIRAIFKSSAVAGTKKPPVLPGGFFCSSKNEVLTSYPPLQRALLLNER